MGLYDSFNSIHVKYLHTVRKSNHACRVCQDIFLIAYMLKESTNMYLTSYKDREDKETVKFYIICIS